MEHLGFRYFAERDPERLAATGPRGDVWTRGDLARTANALSRALRKQGLRPDDRLAIISPNCVELIGVHLAATQIGLYVVVVNWHLASPEISHIIRDSRVSVLFVHEEIYAAVVGALPAEVLRDVRIVCIGAAPGVPSLRELVESEPGHALDDVVPGTTLYYTSATTGLPKAVVRPRDQADAGLVRELRIVAANCEKAGIALDAGQSYLCISMLYHGAPLNGVLHTLHLGNPVAIMSGWSALRILEEIQRHRVVSTFMVPSMFGRLLKLPREIRQRFDLSCLRCVSHGAAPCPIEIKKQMIEWLGPILFESYGASEGGGTFVTSEDWLRHPGTVGRPFPGGDIRILDDEGQRVPAGVVGNVYMKSYNGARFQYAGDAAKTDAAHRGEYFTVGDLGHVNEEGYLFLCDRRTDMINSSGMKIYPAEIERVLITHPAVRDCAVIGVPDAMLGEAAVAAVELEEAGGGSSQLSAELLQLLLEQLGAMKVPQRIHYVEKVPRDPSGKLFRRLLKDRLPA